MTVRTHASARRASTLVALATCLLAVIAILARMHVPVAEATRFFAYVAGYVVAPGCVLFATLDRNSRLRASRWLAVGWGLGYVLEVAAFNATAAMNARWLFAWYPVIAIAICVAWLAWRGRLRRTIRDARDVFVGALSQWRVTWSLCALAVGIVGLLALAAFTSQPLPHTIARADYFEDLIWFLSAAANALHHFPITDPQVSGEPLVYYGFIFSHLAASAQVTGIALSTIVMRLYIVAMLIALVVQLYALGRSLDNRRLTGLFAVVLMLFVGEIDPLHRDIFAFWNINFALLWSSPSYLMGLVLFAPLLIETARAARFARANDIVARVNWLVIVVLVIGCANSKASSLPVLVGGVVAFSAWSQIARRRVHAPLLAIGGIAAFVFALNYVTAYRFMGGNYALRPFASAPLFKLLAPLTDAATATDGAANVALLAAITALGVFGQSALQLIGIGANWLRPRNVSAGDIAFVGMFLVGVAAFCLLDFSDVAGLSYFMNFGFVPASAVAAKGFRGVWERLRAASWARRIAVGAPLAALCALAVLDTPLDNLPRIRAAADGQLLYGSQHAGMTADLYRGLVWLRDHSAPSDVVAVNAQKIGGAADYADYAAFSERSVFFGAYAFSTRAKILGDRDVRYNNLQPFPERAELNERVFARGDVAALQTMTREYGVRFLLADKVHAAPLPDFGDAVELVFGNRDVDIYAVR